MIWSWHARKNNVHDLTDAIDTQYTPISSGNYLFTKESWRRAGGYKTRALCSWTFGFSQLATGTKIALLPDTWYMHRLTPNSKWRVNEAKGNNAPAALAIIRQYPEVFTDETNAIIKKYDLKKRTFFDDRNNKLFKLRDEQELEQLFTQSRHNNGELDQQNVHQ